MLIEHDRALSSCTFYYAIRAKIDALQQRAAAQADAQAVEQLNSLAASLKAYPFPLISRVKDELGELERTCSSSAIDSSWTVLDNGASGDKIATYYRTEAGSGTHSFLVSGLVQAPLLNLVAMLKEAQLLYKWIPAVSESTLLSALDESRYRMLLRVTLQLFWPMANRESLLYAYGDMLGDSVGIFFRSLAEDGSEDVFLGAGAPGADGRPTDVRAPPTQKGAVRVKVKTGGFWFTPQPLPAGAAAAGAQPMTRVRAIFNVDPRFPALPFWFINTMSKKFCAQLLVLLRQKAPKLFASPSSVYSQALVQQARTYDEIRRRLQEVEQAAAADGAKNAAAAVADSAVLPAPVAATTSG